MVVYRPQCLFVFVLFYADGLTLISKDEVEGSSVSKQEANQVWRFSLCFFLLLYNSGLSSHVT